MTKEIERPFSLQDDFMNWKVNDLLYGFMRTLSTAEPVLDKDGNKVMTDKGIPQYKEYFLESEYRKTKSTIALLCSCSIRTIDRNKDALIERGLLIPGQIKIKNSLYKCFYFPTFDCENGVFYQNVDKKLLEYLINTRNVHCIKVYIYLRDKYLWKKKTNEKYLFSIHELCKALGYANTTKSAEVIIGDIIKSFNLEGMIRYTEVREKLPNQEGKIVSAPYMQLEFVAGNMNELS